MANDLKDDIDVVTKLKTLKAEALEALQEQGADAAEELVKAKRYAAICFRIREREEKIFKLTPDEMKKFNEA